jgi:hypothetical protein
MTMAIKDISRVAFRRAVGEAMGHASHGRGEHLTGGAGSTIARNGAAKRTYAVEPSFGMRNRNLGQGVDVHALVPQKGAPPDASSANPLDIEAKNPKQLVHAKAVVGHRSRRNDAVGSSEPGENAKRGHSDCEAEGCAVLNDALRTR